jgi:hypothetical protein
MPKKQNAAPRKEGQKETKKSQADWDEYLFTVINYLQNVQSSVLGDCIRDIWLSHFTARDSN